MKHLRDVWLPATAVLRSHPIRSFGLGTGPMLGILVLLLTVGLTNQAREEVRTSFSALGADLVVLAASSETTGAPSPVDPAGLRRIKDSQLVIETAELGLALGVPTLTSVIPDSALPETTTLNVLTASGNLTEVLSVEPSVGRFFENVDEGSSLPVAILGASIAASLGVGDDLSGLVHLGDIPFGVVGILEPSPIFRDLNTAVLVTPDAAERFLGGASHPIRVIAAVHPGLEQEALETLPLLANLGGSPPLTSTLVGRLDEAERAVSSSLIRLGIGLGATVVAISMAIVGVVMHRMVMERMLEVGLSAALGHPPQAIAVQMMIEAMIVSFTGAVTGGLLANALLTATAVTRDVATGINLVHVVAAVVFVVSTSALAAWSAVRRVRDIDPLVVMKPL